MPLNSESHPERARPTRTSRVGSQNLFLAGVIGLGRRRLSPSERQCQPAHCASRQSSVLAISARVKDVSPLLRLKLVRPRTNV